MTVHVGRLRQKLEPDPERPALDRHGVGRRLPVRAVIAPSVAGHASRDDPLARSLAVVVLAAAAVGAGLALRARHQPHASLRHLVLAITFGSLAIGAVVALLARPADGARRRPGPHRPRRARRDRRVRGRAGRSSPRRRSGATPARLEAAVRPPRGRRPTARTACVAPTSSATSLAPSTSSPSGSTRSNASGAGSRHERRRDADQCRPRPAHAARARCGRPIEALADGVAPDPAPLPAGDGARRRGAPRAVDDLFLLSRIEAGRLELSAEPLDLAELADEAVEALAPAAASRDRRSRLRSPGAVHGARQRDGDRPGRSATSSTTPSATCRPGRPSIVVDGAERPPVRGDRRGTRVPGRVRRARVRALRPRRPEPDPRDRRRRARAGDRPRPRRSPRRADLDRATARRARRLRAASGVSRYRRVGGHVSGDRGRGG